MKDEDKSAAVRGLEKLQALYDRDDDILWGLFGLILVVFAVGFIFGIVFGAAIGSKLACQ